MCVVHTKTLNWDITVKNFVHLYSPLCICLFPKIKVFVTRSFKVSLNKSFREREESGQLFHFWIEDVPLLYYLLFGNYSKVNYHLTGLRLGGLMGNGLGYLDVQGALFVSEKRIVHLKMRALSWWSKPYFQCALLEETALYIWEQNKKRNAEFSQGYLPNQLLACNKGSYLCIRGQKPASIEIFGYKNIQAQPTGTSSWFSNKKDYHTFYHPLLRTYFQIVHVYLQANI